MATKKLTKSEIKKKKCTYPDPPDEGIPSWMATFADMMTLLFAFFVLIIYFKRLIAHSLKIRIKAIKKLSLTFCVNVCFCFNLVRVNKKGNNYESRASR